MSEQSSDPLLMQDARDAQAYAFSSMGAFAWICYDTMITMDQEVMHVWQTRWSPAKVLYLISRYVTVVSLFFWWLTGAVSELPGPVELLPSKL